MKKLLLSVVAMLSISMAIAQTGNISGMVTDNGGLPLIGASVLVDGTTMGTVTDVDGKFMIANVPTGEQVIEMSYLGFSTLAYSLTVTEGNNDLGTMRLDNAGVGLEEVVVVGVADIAKDRKTPVAVSTLSAREITKKLGNQELPELLNSTPSVYATKSGGGYGDSRINVRGFDQVNTAVMINGVPVNDMENGRVFWSNWAGLGDVTSGMQVQRGLGSSKLAISSVGGTINILTKTTDKDQGGKVSVGVGNDGYLKTLAAYNTGKMDNNLAVSLLLSRTSGDGYVDGTAFEGYNYFVGLGYEAGKNNFQLTVTGAPQVHNQRTTSFFNMATLEDYLEHGTKYNYNHGFLNGEEFNWRQNFYHKPIASLNWDLNLSEKSKLSTVFYASYGRGGGTGDIGRLGGNFASSSRFRDENGLVRWDDIVSSNSGNQTTFSNGFEYANPVDGQTGEFIVNDDELRSSDLDGLARRNGFIRRSSINSHNWFGLVSNFNHKINDVLTWDIGIDLRKYKGIHYRRVNNLLGADGYRDNDDVNNPLNIVRQEVSHGIGDLWNVFRSIDDDEKINYYNEGLVNWSGVFTQLEYSKNAVSAFLQGSVSNQGFQRVDYFNEAPGNQESETVNILGGNIKGGLNYNINRNHNVFFNSGYYSKQPLFDAIFLNFANDVNEDYQNEKIIGLELGYGYRSNNLRANVNLYRTSWNDRFMRISTEVDVNNTPDDRDDDVEATANLLGVKQVHTGIEVEATYEVNNKIGLSGMLSVGNWEYGGDVTGNLLDDNQAVVGTTSLFLDGVKVGDAAQTTFRLGLDVQPINRLYLDLSYRGARNLYASISADDFDTPDHQGSLQLPNYGLLDAGLSYSLDLSGSKSVLGFRLNVNNVLDTEYIAESRTNFHARPDDETFDGIATGNKVFFGFGRTWNASVTYSF